MPNVSAAQPSHTHNVAGIHLAHLAEGRLFPVLRVTTFAQEPSICDVIVMASLTMFNPLVKHQLLFTVHMFPCYKPPFTEIFQAINIHITLDFLA